MFGTVHYRVQDVVGKLYIVNKSVDSIFGRGWIRETQLDAADIYTLNKDDDNEGKIIPALRRLMIQYKKISREGVRKVPDKRGHLNLNDDTRPIYTSNPDALKEIVEKE